MRWKGKLAGSATAMQQVQQFVDRLTSTQFPLTTKGIAKDDIKSKLHHQQPQQPQHQQQQQQQQQNGTTTTCGE